jgi:hypothetical protein
MSDGDIDYGKYSREELLRMLPRINKEEFPLSYENACRELRRKWPEAPDDLGKAIPRHTTPPPSMAPRANPSSSSNLNRRRR